MRLKIQTKDQRLSVRLDGVLKVMDNQKTLSEYIIVNND
jgi:hypothetical protein